MLTVNKNDILLISLMVNRWKILNTYFEMWGEMWAFHCNNIFVTR